MIWVWVYCVGVALAALLIRWDAERSGAEYDPVAAFVACLLWPGGLALFLASALGLALMALLRLDGNK